jgi:hypothetical protein
MRSLTWLHNPSTNTPQYDDAVVEECDVSGAERVTGEWEGLYIGQTNFPWNYTKNHAFHDCVFSNNI